jgi:hypothetical protein
MGRPVSGSTSTFPPRPPVCSLPPSPATFVTGSSSTELYVPFRVLQPATCPVHTPASLSTNRWPQSASRGVHPLFATSAGGSHLPRRKPIPTLRSAHGVSHALDGFIRHRPCGFVSPRSRVQGWALQGIVPPDGAVRGFPRPLPSCRWDDPACGCPRQPNRPRLQGLALRQECGDNKQRLSRLLLRAPRGLPSSGYSLPAPFSARKTPVPRSPSGLARP